MKKSKIIVSILTIILILITFATQVNADVDPNKFQPDPITQNEIGDGIEVGQKIVSVINIVGTIILVLAIMGLGIKYLVGSAEQRSDYKKTMIPILIGAFILYGVSWILKLIYNARIQ